MQMKILSFNACILVKGLGFTVNDKKEQRLKKMLKLFKPYDIVCIQEVWESLWGKHVDFYNACYNEGWHVATTKVTGLTNTGNIILSKDIAGESDWIVFKNSSTWQRLMSNGILYAKIYTPEPIHVFNTHLHCDTHPCLNSGNIRMKQVRELNEFMKDIVKPEEKWILCGDFNIRAPSEEYEQLESIVNAESLLKEKEFPNTYNNESFLAPIGWKTEKCCIDHIFTNIESKECNVLTKIDLSDHFPVEIIF